ncbi:hypothetical protein C0993_011441, partial [Termitomyces sp. T159_Od127]
VISFTNKWINLQIASGCGTELLAAKWWGHIGLSQSKEHVAMYMTALDASLPLKGLENILDESIQFDTIQVQVQEFVNSVSKKIKPAGTVSEPAIMFYFDEAHHLTKTTVTAHVPKCTAYQCLCKALTYMMSTPVFAFFLSTYSRLSDSTLHVRTFWSSHPQLNESQESDDNMNALFVELPFDTWKNPILVTKELIPALAVRVGLTFESNRDEAVLLEGLLVSNSMRTVELLYDWAGMKDGNRLGANVVVGD